MYRSSHTDTLSYPSKRVGYGERERASWRKRDGEQQGAEGVGESLKGVTFGANSVPSGCLHQFYRRFLNPAAGTDFTRPHLVAAHKSLSHALGRGGEGGEERGEGCGGFG